MSPKNRRTVTKEEETLFAAVVKNVRQRQQTTPIVKTKIPDLEPPPRAEPKSKPTQAAIPAPAPPIVNRPQSTYWQNDGIDKRTAEKLRKGRLPIEARLDLHGMRQAAAHPRLFQFIRSSHTAGLRCVLVITGKGGEGGTRGVLNVNVPRWLSDPTVKPLILSIRPAQPKDGGDGAYYILLRRQRQIR